MSIRLQYQNAARKAEELVKSLGIRSLPVDPFAIAEQHDIEVQASESETLGISGCLMKVGDNFGIIYTTRIKSEGFKRFTISHELGHYFLPGHIDALFSGEQGAHQSLSGFASKNPYELEADHFAASLLMPKYLFVKSLRQSGQGTTAIKMLAESCQTSLTATAIRYAGLSEDPVMIIVSMGNKIDYCFMSEAIRECRGIQWIRKGDLVPSETDTFDFNSDKNNVVTGNSVEGLTNLSYWLSGAPEMEMKEDVIGLGDYGKTLTVLFTDEAINGDDDEIW